LDGGPHKLFIVSETRRGPLDNPRILLDGGPHDLFIVSETPRGALDNPRSLLDGGPHNLFIVSESGLLMLKASVISSDAAQNRISQFLAKTIRLAFLVRFVLAFTVLAFVLITANERLRRFGDNRWRGVGATASMEDTQESILYLVIRRLGW
jgi:hypothetical protein